MPPFRLPKLPSGLSTEQKVALVLLTFLGLGGVVIGFLSFGANLRRPFELQLANAPKDFQFDSQKEAADLEAMKKRDTDSDGLSDYDEVYVYKTSPYLADTDSDGITDKDEVFAGTDPNCPRGKTCAGSPVVAPDAAAPAAGTSLQQPVQPNDQYGLTGVAASGGFKTEADVVAYLKKMDTTQQKSLLTQAGLTEDKIKTLTDAQIKDLFDKTVDEAAAKGQFKALLTAQTQNP